jgi:hypothetical protein
MENPRPFCRSHRKKLMWGGRPGRALQPCRKSGERALVALSPIVESLYVRLSAAIPGNRPSLFLVQPPVDWHLVSVTGRRTGRVRCLVPRLHIFDHCHGTPFSPPDMVALAGSLATLGPSCASTCTGDENILGHFIPCGARHASRINGQVLSVVWLIMHNPWPNRYE